MKAKVNNNWVDVSEIYTKISGDWKLVLNGYTKVNGTWKKIYQLYPYDAKIEYLESDSGSYIDTEIIANSSTKLVCDCSFNSTSYLIGYGLYSSSRFYFGTSNSKFIFGVGSATKNPSVSIDTNRHIFSVSGSGQCYIDSTSVSVGKSVSGNTRSILLFARNRSDTVDWKGGSKLYSAQIYQNNVLVQDLIPVRVGSVGYMYDKISGELYGNAGTGSFTLGPDITQ